MAKNKQADDGQPRYRKHGFRVQNVRSGRITTLKGSRRNIATILYNKIRKTSDEYNCEKPLVAADFLSEVPLPEPLDWSSNLIFNLGFTSQNNEFIPMYRASPMTMPTKRRRR